MTLGRKHRMHVLTRLRVSLMLFVGIVSALIAAAVLVVAVRPPAARAAVAASDDLRSTVTVVGDGRVLVQPDVANVTFGVEATAPTQAAAQADAATRMQAVVDTLVGLG